MKLASRVISLDVIDGQSTMFWLMAWCRQTRETWVNIDHDLWRITRKGNNKIVWFNNSFSHYSKTKKALADSGIDLQALGHWLDGKWGDNVLVVKRNCKIYWATEDTSEFLFFRYCRVMLLSVCSLNQSHHVDKDARAGHIAIKLVLYKKHRDAEQYHSHYQLSWMSNNPDSVKGWC